jgi:putative spermidine/putrescine transport system substrate-binding protein
MRRRRLLGLLTASALAGARGAAAQRRDLVIVSWGGAYQEAQREALFRPWMATRGRRLLEETWDGGLAALRARAGAWDLVQVGGDELLTGCAEGMFERLDPEAVGGEANYLPGTLTECGVGNVTWALVLAWDQARLRGAPRSWADFFDLERWPGRRALRRGPKGTLEIALLGDGVAPAELYRLLGTEAGQDRAFARLETLRGAVAWWERGSDPPRWLAAGEVAMAAAWNGRIAAANAEGGAELGMRWEGSIRGMDSWAVLRGSPNLAAALDFLRFAGRAEVQAALPPLIPYGVTARGAEALIPREVLARLPTAPRNAGAGLRVDDAFWARHRERLAARFEEWTRR